MLATATLSTVLTLTLSVAATALNAPAPPVPALMRATMLPEHPIGPGKTDFSELKMEFIPTPSVPPEPALGPRQVLVRVHASSVNPVDAGLSRSLTAVRTHAPGPACPCLLLPPPAAPESAPGSRGDSCPQPRRPGSDVAGVVARVGPGCTSPIAKVGTAVWGLLNSATDPCPTKWPGSASCLAAGAWADYAVASEDELSV